MKYSCTEIDMVELAQKEFNINQYTHPDWHIQQMKDLSEGKVKITPDYMAFMICITLELNSYVVTTSEDTISAFMYGYHHKTLKYLQGYPLEDSTVIFHLLINTVVERFGEKYLPDLINKWFELENSPNESELTYRMLVGLRYLDDIELYSQMGSAFLDILGGLYLEHKDEAENDDVLRFLSLVLERNHNI